MREITYALYFIKIKKKISLTGIAAAVQEKEQGLTPGPIFFRFIIIIIVIHTSMELSEFYMVKEKKNVRMLFQHIFYGTSPKYVRRRCLLCQF